MKLDELKQLVNNDIKATKEYSDFMKTQIQPMLTTVGTKYYEHLHFFNLGYQFAMEKVSSFLELCNE